MKVIRLLHTVVTYLELRTPPERVVQPPASFAGGRVELVPAIPLSFYRYLYREVGQAHHWTSRNLSDEALLAELRYPGITVHVLYCDGAPAGWFELDAARRPGETRIVHFGLLAEFRGKGLARYLLGQAVEAAFATGARIVTLETNELDHPTALPLYTGFGFTITGKRNVSTPAIQNDGDPRHLAPR